MFLTKFIPAKHASGQYVHMELRAHILPENRVNDVTATLIIWKTLYECTCTDIWNGTYIVSKSKYDMVHIVHVPKIWNGIYIGVRIYTDKWDFFNWVIILQYNCTSNCECTIYGTQRERKRERT